jgi:hypothetical protein
VRPESGRRLLRVQTDAAPCLGQRAVQLEQRLPGAEGQPDGAAGAGKRHGAYGERGGQTRLGVPRQAVQLAGSDDARRSDSDEGDVQSVRRHRVEPEGRQLVLTVPGERRKPLIIRKVSIQ